MSVLPPSDMNARVDNNKRSVPGHEQRTSRKEGTAKRITVEELGKPKRAPLEKTAQNHSEVMCQTHGTKR